MAVLDQRSRLYVAGHRGLVGGALVRHFESRGYRNILTATRAECDLTRAGDVERWFAQAKPDVVFLAAAKVGGILANSEYPADFIRDNLAIQLNVIDAAYRHGAQKLVFLGSSCIYPKLAPQPMREDVLLTGPLEPTNQPYAIAKIAGIEMCNAYRRQYGFDAISLMPTNLYGPGDNFDLRSSHVLAALIRKFVEAADSGSATVDIWGTGTPRREFLHVDDLAAACEHLALHYAGAQLINVGVGEDISIRELAEMIGELDFAGFSGELDFDTSKPDGTPRKLLDVSRLHDLGWRASIPLRDGIAATIEWYRANRAA